MKYGIDDQLPPDTADLVLRFAVALSRTLHAARVKYGYQEDWKKDDWEAECRKEMLRHIDKGDPVDVAAYCAFMWHHGWSTNPREPYPLKELNRLSDELGEEL